MIRLGNCLDLLEPDHVEYVQSIYTHYKKSIELIGSDVPRNTRKYRKLDCAVFEHVYRAVETSDSGLTIDSARGVYVPSGGDRRVCEGSWISRDAHIQLCVRNPKSLLGVWLHHPAQLEAKDVREIFPQDAPLPDEPDLPPGKAKT